MTEKAARKSYFGGRIELVLSDVWVADRRSLTLEGGDELSEGMSISKVTSPDDPLLALLPDRRRGFALRTLKAGDTSYMLVENGKAIAWWWTSERSHMDRVAGMRVTLRPGEVYLYDIWTVKEHRRTGAAFQLVTAVFRELVDAGFEYFITYIDNDNKPSQGLASRFGLVPTQQFRSIRQDQRGLQIPRSDHPRGGPASRRRDGPVLPE